MRVRYLFGVGGLFLLGLAPTFIFLGTHANDGPLVLTIFWGVIVAGNAMFAYMMGEESKEGLFE